ncbi:alpha/beta hydrolase [Streptomyces rugosispiralis]|uniref:Alpha/beta hydrolase n=1 Tax=Streptomyces rugosispiralis TaxID=2967341 RepID=A0ABT1USY1_9ACTN|nr:alpha/beta hydrolase [Streptomyces rugosispiralis]MCQ8188225.1 alpha/beta hydrolase [Streptomyces rugosispiralis]
MAADIRRTRRLDPRPVLTGIEASTCAYWHHRPAHRTRLGSPDAPPVLLVASAHDPVTPIEGARRLRHRLPGARRRPLSVSFCESPAGRLPRPAGFPRTRLPVLMRHPDSCRAVPEQRITVVRRATTTSGDRDQVQRDRRKCASCPTAASAAPPRAPAPARTPAPAPAQDRSAANHTRGGTDASSARWPS